MIQNPSAIRSSILVICDRLGTEKPLRNLLSAQSDFVVLEPSKLIGDPIPRFIEPFPDLIVVRNAENPDAGLKWIVSLRKTHPNVPVILISGGEEVIYTERAFRKGVNGYVTTHKETFEIVEAARSVLSGNRYASDMYCQWLIQRVASGRSASIRYLLSDLSDRERTVFESIAEGQSNRAISENLGIHAKTVATYRSRIKAKLGIEDGRVLSEIASEWAREQ